VRRNRQNVSFRRGHTQTVTEVIVIDPEVVITTSCARATAATVAFEPRVVNTTTSCALVGEPAGDLTSADS
jgi:hypothetical protein